MASRVPRMPDDREQLRALPAIQGPGSVSERAIGGGPEIQQFERATRGAVSEAANLAFRAQHNADQLAVTEYDDKLARKRLELWQDAQKRLGKNALGYENADGERISLPDEYLSKFRKYAEEQGEGLHRRQKPSANRRFMAQEFELKAKLEQHSYTESIKYDNQTTQSRLITYRDETLDNYKTPKVMRRKMDLAVNEIQDWGERQGHDQDLINEKAADWKSKTHVSLISLMLENGDSEQAKVHFTMFKDELVGDDETNVKKIFKSFDEENLRVAKKKAAEAKVEYERGLFIQAGARDDQGRPVMTVNDANKLFEFGMIDRDFYNTLVKRVEASVNDDPMIPAEDKAKRWFELLQEFQEETEGKVDDKGKIIQSAGTDDVIKRAALQRKVVESAPYLTTAQEKNLLFALQANTDPDFDVKRKIFDMAKRHLMILPITNIYGGMLTSVLFERIFAKEVTPQKATEIAKETIENQQARTNLNKIMYPVDMTIYRNGKAAKVIGHDELGNPFFKAVKE